mmetsp:Transcript_124379/g.323129  ORF Transcript_124379/g.323129 Transcript_124379/m.323129 type:complete len:778 (-) Transcript_124379:343-2676(-)
MPASLTTEKTQLSMEVSAAMPVLGLAGEHAAPPREYLLFWKGRPLAQGFSDKQMRTDALARVLRGALACKSSVRVHVVFEDASLLSFTPEFFGTWCAAAPAISTSDSSPSTDPGSQMRLVQLLGALRQELDLCREGGPVALGGACFWPPQQGRSSQQGTRCCVERVLVGAARSGPSLGDSEGQSCFDVVFEFNEEGCPLLFNVLGRQADGGSASAVVGRALVVLGGVRDMEDWEKSTVQEMCGEFELPYRLLRLGRHSELTSKLVKAFEAADDMGMLGPALAHCKAEGWTRRDPPPAGPGRSPYHVVVVASVPLASYVATPEAANVLVDTFVRSKKAYQQTMLTFVGDDDLSFTFYGDPGWALHENDALVYLQRQLLRAQKVNLAQVVATWVRKMRGAGGSRVSARTSSSSSGAAPMLLYADESSGRPLKHPASRGPLPGAANGPAVMAVFAPASRGEEVRRAALQAGILPDALARASVGGSGVGLALLSLLHGEHLLAASIRATAAAPLKPMLAPPPAVRSRRPSVAGTQAMPTVVSTRPGWARMADCANGVVVASVPQSMDIGDATTDAGSDVQAEDCGGSNGAIDEVSVSESTASPSKRWAEVAEGDEAEQEHALQEGLQTLSAASEVIPVASQRRADVSEREENERVQGSDDEASVRSVIAAASANLAQGGVEVQSFKPIGGFCGNSTGFTLHVAGTASRDSAYRVETVQGTGLESDRVKADGSVARPAAAPAASRSYADVAAAAATAAALPVLPARAKQPLQRGFALAQTCA